METQIPALLKIKAFVESHGFAASLSPTKTKVLIEIPWIRTTTGERGTDTYAARTWAQARRILGY